MAKAFGKRLKLRLFLEGIEVPIISANIQVAPNSPMVCSIQVPPLAEGTRLLPRTLVHLFFLDFYEQDNPFFKAIKEQQADLNKVKQGPDNQTGSGGDQQDAKTLLQAITVTSNTSYKLLFGGEMIGFVWSKKTAHRSLMLQCEDFSNYWDYAYQYGNTGLFGPGIKAMFSGGGTTIFSDFLSSKGSVINAIVSRGKCSTFPRLKGLAAGIIRLIEAIGGVYFPRGSGKGIGKRYAGQNAFFSLAELRLHLTHMIGSIENDPTSSRLLNRGAFSQMFERALGGLGGQVSIRKSINALTQIIFYEMYAQPCPKYIPGNESEVTGDVERTLLGDDSTRDIATAAVNAAESVSKIAIEVNLLVLSDDVKSKVRTLLGQLNGVIRTLHGGLVRMPFKIRQKVQGNYSRAISTIGQARSTLGRALQSGDLGPITDKVFEKLTLAAEALSAVAEIKIKIPFREALEPQRMLQQIFRPDIWFGAPPRCNVIFPENYNSLEYQRMFLQEPTRFLLKTNDEFFGEGALFDSYYFAPQAGDARGNNTRLADIKSGGLMEHELFTGILPVFEKMGEFNIFASGSGSQKTPKLSKVGYAQRAANFIYFKHRFNSRQMRVVGKFNPYIACGFPGLIIDRYIDTATIALYNNLKQKAVEIQSREGGNAGQTKYGEHDLPPQEIKDILGTNFLGNFTQLTHSVSQAKTTGQTEILCSYPRQPEESVEFLGTVEPNQTVRKRFDQDAVRATTVAALFPPRLFSFGPTRGRVIGVIDVTGTYSPRGLVQGVISAEDLGSTADEAGRPLPLFIPGRQKGARKKPELIQVGRVVTGALLNSEQVSEAAGDPNRPVTFRAFLITEEVPRFQREFVDVPAEEFIRPGWYGDVWSSPKIGKAYEEFFDIGAITDVQQISDPGGGSMGTSTENAKNAQVEADQGDILSDPVLDAPALISLGDKASIQDAVEFLLLTYSYIRGNNMDVDEFINAYTWRPITSLHNIFGSEDLQFSDDGSSVIAGKEGFHSKAFGPFDDLRGLVAGLHNRPESGRSQAAVLGGSTVRVSSSLQSSSPRLASDSTALSDKK